MNTTTVDPCKPRAGRREWTALAVLMLPLLLVSMDVSVLYFAVPFIAGDLEPTATQQLWMFDIYGFVLAGLLLTMGVVGDRIGRRRLLLIGAVAFGAASVLAAYSTSAEMLIVARAVMGSRRCDLDAEHACPAAQPVPGRQAASNGDRGVDSGHRRRRRGRARPQRHPARALLVGLGVPHQPAGDGDVARVRPHARARVPGGQGTALRPGRGGAVARHRAADRVRRQAGRRRELVHPRLRGDRSGSNSRPGVRAPTAHRRSPDDRRTPVRRYRFPQLAGGQSGRDVRPRGSGSVHNPVPPVRARHEPASRGSVEPRPDRCRDGCRSGRRGPGWPAWVPCWWPQDRSSWPPRGSW